MLTRKLFRTALRYKAQFLSMVLMIAIGTGVFLGFHIEWKSLERNADAFLRETKYADYRLYSESGFTEDDLRSVRGIAGVDAASRFLSIPAAVKGTSSSVALQVTEDAAVSSPLVMSGAAYDESGDGIWLSDRFADENGIRLGDTLTLTYLGLEISGPVVGLIKSGENMICVADENQLMPDFARFGFAYVSPQKLASVLGRFTIRSSICSGWERPFWRTGFGRRRGRRCSSPPRKNTSPTRVCRVKRRRAKRWAPSCPYSFSASRSSRW
ncbi:MAG: hypothetical protein ACLUFV_04890 [Acutalibacteraceae bacterium]